MTFFVKKNPYSLLNDNKQSNKNKLKLYPRSNFQNKHYKIRTKQILSSKITRFVADPHTADRDTTYELHALHFTSSRLYDTENNGF